MHNSLPLLNPNYSIGNVHPPEEAPRRADLPPPQELGIICNSAEDFQSIDIGLFENYHACGRRLPPTAAKRPLCARPTAMSDSTTYRNVVYRLSPGDAATTNLLLGIRDACRFAWNEIKEAREIQYEHACGRKIESPTFFTLGTAFKTLWDQTEWLRKHSYTIVR